MTKATKAAEMARVSAKGGIHLLWGLVTSTVISAIGTIFIHLHSGRGKFWFIFNCPYCANPDRDISRLGSQFSYGKVFGAIQC